MDAICSTAAPEGTRLHWSTYAIPVSIGEMCCVVVDGSSVTGDHKDTGQRLLPTSTHMHA